MRVMSVINETTRTQSAGICIYCGSTDGLTDEHVVPLALGGRLVIPKSSCKACAKITSKFELSVLRGFMLPARTVAGLPTRRPKERPTSFEMEVGDGQDLRTEAFSVDNFPVFMHLPLFPPPDFFSGHPYRSSLHVRGLATIHFGKDPKQFIEEQGVSTIQQTSSIDPVDYARMLAKIAYCTAIAEEGLLPREGSPVLPFILGSADDANVWLGSAEFPEGTWSPDALHVMYTMPLRSNTNPKEAILVGRVKLFANAGAPGYEVIVHRTVEG